MVYDKGEIEVRSYPKALILSPGVSSGIRARRCKKCNIVYFTSDNEFTKCRNCKNKSNVEVNTK